MMEQTFTIEIKGGHLVFYLLSVAEMLIMLSPAPPSVRISNKPSSGELLVQEGDTVELECQVCHILVT